MVGNKIWIHPDFKLLVPNIWQNQTKVLNFRIDTSTDLDI